MCTTWNSIQYLLKSHLIQSLSLVHSISMYSLITNGIPVSTKSTFDFQLKNKTWIMKMTWNSTNIFDFLLSQLSEIDLKSNEIQLNTLEFHWIHSMSMRFFSNPFNMMCTLFTNGMLLVFNIKSSIDSEFKFEWNELKYGSEFHPPISLNQFILIPEWFWPEYNEIQDWILLHPINITVSIPIHSISLYSLILSI